MARHKMYHRAGRVAKDAECAATPMKPVQVRMVLLVDPEEFMDNVDLEDEISAVIRSYARGFKVKVVSAKYDGK